jgi:hypothetical protein
MMRNICLRFYMFCSSKKWWEIFVWYFICFIQVKNDRINDPEIDHSYYKFKNDVYDF